MEKVRSKKKNGDSFSKSLFVQKRINGSHIAVATIVPHVNQATKKPENDSTSAPKLEATVESFKLRRNKYINIAARISGRIT